MNTFDQVHIWHPYAKIPNEVSTHVVKSAEGVYLNLESDKRVVDGMSSWWSAIHGYNHPTLNQAITTQLGKMSHVMFGGLTHDPAIALAKTLVEITPENLTKVFFTDSGSVNLIGSLPNCILISLSCFRSFFASLSCCSNCGSLAIKYLYYK